MALTSTLSKAQLRAIKTLAGLSGMEVVDTADFRLWPNFEGGGFVLAPKAADRGYSLVSSDEATALVAGLPADEVGVVAL